MNIEQRRAAFAKRLQGALQKSGKAGLSGEEIARLLARQGVAVTSQTVSNWRGGRTMPKLEQMEAVARMLRADPGELAFGKPRTAEPRAGYGQGGDEQSLLDGFSLLGDDEREALRGLIRLLGPKARRPGRRRAAVKD